MFRCHERVDFKKYSTAESADQQQKQNQIAKKNAKAIQTKKSNAIKRRKTKLTMLRQFTSFWLFSVSFCSRLSV